MKRQIKRLSPHQNGKVFAILLAVSVLPIFTPMMIIMTFVMPDVDPNGNHVEFPKMMFALMPIFYLIFGYISTAIGCLIYNFIFRFIGGFEFEFKDDETHDVSS